MRKLNPITLLYIFALPLMLPLFLAYGLPPTQFIKETRSDIQEAIVNIPERVPSGPEVLTRAGQQLTPGKVKKDFVINQEIYNDLDQLTDIANRLMKNVVALSSDYSLKETVLLQLTTLSQLISGLGIRYNFTSQFDSALKEITTIQQEIKVTPKAADFMLFKVRLEIILAQIENAIRTKLNS